MRRTKEEWRHLIDSWKGKGRFYVCRKWHDSPGEEVLEFFDTQDQAVEYSRHVARGTGYTVMIGELG